MFQLSTEVKINLSKINKKKPEFFIDDLKKFLSKYLIEADESELEDVALLLVVDELPVDPALHPFYYLLQKIKKKDLALFKLAQECIMHKVHKSAMSMYSDISSKLYTILFRAFYATQFRISTKDLNKLSIRIAKAIGLVLFQKNMLIVEDNLEPLKPSGCIALEQILCHSKIASLAYHSTTNDIIPNWETFKKILPHLTFLGLTQSLLDSFTPTDWQLFGEALSKSKLEKFRLYRVSYLIQHPLLPQDQLQALANALSQGKVTQLSLIENDIRANTVHQWEEFYNAFSQSTVTNLDLSHNELIGGNEELKWAALLTATLSKNNVTHLNLAQNQLGDLSKKSWEMFAKSLFQSKVTHLDLSGNRLNTAIINFLDTPMPLLTGSHVTDLNLADNDLYDLSTPAWQQFWVNFLSQSNVIRLNLGNLSLGKLSAEQWQVFCDIIKNSKVRVVTLEKPAVVDAVQQARSKELILVLGNKKGTLEGLIRHTLWNVYQMKVKQVNSNPDNNNPGNKSLLIKFVKNGQPYEAKVGPEYSEVLGEASDYTAPLRYV